MGDILTFPSFGEEPNFYSMDKEELLRHLKALREEIDRLDEEEPADMESDEHTDWGDAHEELEDLVDEILDRLDELD